MDWRPGTTSSGDRRKLADHQPVVLGDDLSPSTAWKCGTARPAVRHTAVVFVVGADRIELQTDGSYGALQAAYRGHQSCQASAGNRRNGSGEIIPRRASPAGIAAAPMPLIVPDALSPAPVAVYSSLLKYDDGSRLGLRRRTGGVAAAIRVRGLSTVDRQAATRATVDWFGATIAGSVMEPARILVRALATETGGHSRLVPGNDVRLPARAAALINATASHTAEMDDIYREGIYHPGSPTVGAALALAQELDVSGERMLRAIAVGYEIGDRIAETVNPNHYRFWRDRDGRHCQRRAAGADLLELDEKRTAHALATAVTMAAGLQNLPLGRNEQAAPCRPRRRGRPPRRPRGRRRIDRRARRT